MVLVPPIILVFDVSALSAVPPNEWREFSRVGSCFVPQVVYEEMRSLLERAPDPDLERIAKAFHRFYGTSGWKTSDANTHHLVFKTEPGQMLTHRIRVSLAVGRCAYGLAQTFTNSLVVLVTKDRSLMQRIYDIPTVNLCSIAGDALLQWSRTGQRPIAVSQKLQQFRLAHSIPPQPKAVRSLAQNLPLTAPAASLVQSSQARPVAWMSNGVPNFISVALASAGLAIAGYLAWLWVSHLSKPKPPSPQSFESKSVILIS